jgi:hypothetical protein
MNTRTGKIARLPRSLREQLNHRLGDGEPGARLVEWLNELPEVRRVLAEDFGGRPINEQNLSEWRQGGYRDWAKQQERRHLVRQLTDAAGELHAEAGGVEVSQHLAAVLTAELAESARELLATITEPAERWARLQELLRELARVRREDSRAGRLQIERERRARERAQEECREAWRRQHSLSDRLTQRSFLVHLFGQPDLATQALATECAEALLLEAKDVRSGLSDPTRLDQAKSK